jgi:hypothetical protein
MTSSNDKSHSGAGLVTYRGATYPWECDQIEHMNITWYTSKFDQANWNLFAMVGITPSYLREGKFGVAGVQQNITYKRELMAGCPRFAPPFSTRRSWVAGCRGANLGEGVDGSAHISPPRSARKSPLAKPGEDESLSDVRGGCALSARGREPYPLGTAEAVPFPFCCRLHCLPLLAQRAREKWGTRCRGDFTDNAYILRFAQDDKRFVTRAGSPAAKAGRYFISIGTAEAVP